MPFLHGFRRIIYEYQPLVDAVLCVVGLEEGTPTEDRNCNPEEEEDGRCGSLVELLDKESQSAVFEEGISYALFKVAERGLVSAAKVLLRYGADLNFEDPVSYYNPMHIAVLRNQPNMVKMLAEHGADINKRDRIHESSPLDLASEEAERVPCLRTLLDLGADVNAKDKNGKSPLLHALASSDGLTVHNIENIRLLLQTGADVHAATIDGETPVSSLVILVKEALSGSVEDAAEIGRFCLRAARLLLAHGADPSSCLAPDGEEDGEQSLTATSLEYFDRLFPLAVLLLQSGASCHCSHHGVKCWTGYGMVLQRLQAALLDCSDARQEAELLEQAEVLLDLAQVSNSSLAVPFDLHMPNQPPYTQVLQELHQRMVEQETSPRSLRGLCRAFIRAHLKPWPLDERVNALPLPDRLKEYLLPERIISLKPGWDCFRPVNTLQLRP
ncbi:hypothetical protein DPEC_G00263030 [Dallia pectoralis]|uniref:Uncharacterized protein n=1 Tax=Dallia pectoralis TaxID=75939 RepID=A0ACC2FSE0_DALPE|nr:hypothetical protein DPEC_G00263030 [Dallia pectoralis]